MTALVSVSGSCGSTNSSTPRQISASDGTATPRLLHAGPMSVGGCTRPAAKPAAVAAASMAGAAGKRGSSISATSRASAGMPSQGVRHISSMPSTAMDMPSPSWRPAETDCGMTRASQPMLPVAASTMRMSPSAMPAAATSPGPTWPVTSTAETAFIGCTAMGRP